MIAAVFEHVRRDDAADLRDLAAGEAAAALEPLAGIARFAWAYSSEYPFTGLCGDAGERNGVDRLPRRPAESRLAAFPQGKSDVGTEAAVAQEILIAPAPDSAVVDIDAMINAERPAARVGKRPEQQRLDQKQKQATHWKALAMGRISLAFTF